MTVSNTFFDLKNTFECSALMVEASRSATGGVLFGRNLDYPSMGYIHEHTLVTVYRPTGKHAFVSVGFPGLVGVLSGMNDAGLCLAVLEVYDAKDGEPRFDGQGVPYALCHRRLLEECTTIAEAKKLLESMPRTSLLNLAVADRTGTAVFEVTPKQVVHAVRRRRACAPARTISAARRCGRRTSRTLGSTPSTGWRRWTGCGPARRSSASRTCTSSSTPSTRATRRSRRWCSTRRTCGCTWRSARCPSSAGELHELDLAPLFKGEAKKSD